MIRKASACYITTGIYSEGGFFFFLSFFSKSSFFFCMWPQKLVGKVVNLGDWRDIH